MAASASAGGGEPQKQLLSIIRDFAAEKSHGERTVSGLKRRLDDVVAAADAAAAELEAAKRERESAAEELSGSQVQNAIAAASIQALEATISHLQEEISKAGSDLEALKSKGDTERDEFFSQMLELNARIRQFQQMASVEVAEKCSGLASADGHHKNEIIDSEGSLKDLVDKVSNIDAEVHVLDGEYQQELLNHEKLCQELVDIQGRRALMEAVMGETKQLQELGGYPFTISYTSSCKSAIITFCASFKRKFCSFVHVYLQSHELLVPVPPCSRKLPLTQNKRVAELEKVHASLAEELQRRYVCPGCGSNNMVGFGEQSAAAN